MTNSICCRLTSVSMDGLVIPYGGTLDGVTYSYNGASVTPLGLTNFNNNGVQSGVVLDSQSVNVASGAVLDLSGGGTLSGAGFISGRGGSVNVLTTPLVNANPTTPLSKASDKVYAIVPGYASSYAPPRGGGWHGGGWGGWRGGGWSWGPAFGWGPGWGLGPRLSRSALRLGACSDVAASATELVRSRRRCWQGLFSAETRRK